MALADRLDALPPTIDLGHQSTMTFLRNDPYLTRVRVAPLTDHETLYVPPHWHETHDELFRIVKGRMRVLIGTEWKTYVPEDGEVLIPRRTVHSLQCFQGEETIFDERTEPMDPGKEIFFRNFLVTGRVPTNFLYVMVVSYNGDMRPSLPGGIKWLESWLVTILGGYIAPLLGYKIKYDSEFFKESL
ncbi:hypothetical protein GALMADRAFT_139292 [Galerina marginata CBS 339.88]|uniref:Uncharacterized protein n=1 Tax=Galerina marginata (strain CBS 339.88) TaxID=685588 RepID=A0A067TE82_GALM3|nr:hypothetical protein GALMADRAFT_139292 [Galerina marginata CBS 339.88]